MHMHVGFNAESWEETTEKLKTSLLPLLEQGAKLARGEDPDAKVYFSLNASVDIITAEHQPDMPMPTTARGPGVKVTGIREDTPEDTPEDAPDTDEETPSLDDLMDLFKQVAAKHPDKSKKVKSILGKYTEDGKLGSLGTDDYSAAYKDAQEALKGT